MKLELFGLKYEVNHNNKCYIIEASDYYYDNDENKWLVTCEGKVLTKDYELTSSMLVRSFEFTFDTKDEAVEALNIYLLIQGKIDQVVKEYQQKIELLEAELEPIYRLEDPKLVGKTFLNLATITNELIKECPFSINKSCSSEYGVQVTVVEIRWIFLLEEAIAKIEKKYNCKVVNYFADNWTHFNYTAPLYYYSWTGGKYYTRQFAFVFNKD